MRTVVATLLLCLSAVPIALAEEGTPPDTRFGNFYVELPADMQEQPGGEEGLRTFANDQIELVVRHGPDAALDLGEPAGLKRVPAKVGGMPTEMLVFQEEGRMVMAMELAAPDSDEKLALIAYCGETKARLAAGRIFYSVDYKP